MYSNFYFRIEDMNSSFMRLDNDKTVRHLRKEHAREKQGCFCVCACSCASLRSEILQRLR